jgi:oligogalacturonide lyase
MNDCRVLIVLILISQLFTKGVEAQPLLETGGKQMPDEWIDASTHHRVIRLTEPGGNNSSFYFHNRPFIGNSMVFYHSNINQPQDSLAKKTSLNPLNKQLYLLNLTTRRAEPLTDHPVAMSGEIVFNKGGEVYYQSNDSVFSVNAFTRKSRLIFVFPSDFKGSITCVNADGSLLGGAKASEVEKEILKQNPGKSSYFNLIYEAHLPRTLFTIEIKSGKLEKLFTDSAWLNHVQFSSTDPKLMMFCHEGPWHKVNRIWTINVKTKKIEQIHHRVMDMEIAGHEWISVNGKTIWYDLQQPKGETFFLEGHDIASRKKTKYSLTRDEWSIHFNSNSIDQLFCGDGGDSSQVARAKNGQWIYLFKPQRDRLLSEKLVNMKFHNYKLEPNVHFSPDEKWVIFRANFEGTTQVYAVEIEKHQ